MSNSVTPQIVAHQAPLSMGTETLFLFPALQKQQLGFFFFFGPFVFLSRICLNCASCSYVQSLTVSLYYVVRGDICPGANIAAKVPGPGLSYTESLLLTPGSSALKLGKHRPYRPVGSSSQTNKHI